MQARRRGGSGGSVEPPLKIYSSEQTPFEANELIPLKQTNPPILLPFFLQRADRSSKRGYQCRESESRAFPSLARSPVSRQPTVFHHEFSLFWDFMAWGCALYIYRKGTEGEGQNFASFLVIFCIFFLKLPGNALGAAYNRVRVIIRCGL